MSNPFAGPLSFATSEEEVFEVLRSCDGQYFDSPDTIAINPLTEDEVDDPEYDLIRQAAQRHFPKNDYWEEVSGPSSKTIKLNYPMTSLHKCVGDTREKDFMEWVEKCRTELGPTTEFVRSFKVDGTGVALEYERGKFVRGGCKNSKNGFFADDKTENLKMVTGIPHQLPIPITCTVRGELYTPITVFDEINKTVVHQGDKPYKNPRNYTTGSISKEDPEIVKSRRIHFIAHSIIGMENPPYTTEVQRADYCQNILGIPHLQPRLFDPDGPNHLIDLEETISSLDFLVDGIVVAVNDLESQAQLGNHGDKATGNPKGRIAWKLSDKPKEGTVKEIVRRAGRTGKITYRLFLTEPLQFETSVQRATLHNLAFIHEKGITVGTSGMIVKSGGIIPKWVETTKNPGRYEPDMRCPSCHLPTTVIHGAEGKYTEYCWNRECPEQFVRNLIHYLQTFGVKDIGPATTTILAEKGLVKTPADFYRLNVPALTQAGLSERESLRALAAIHMVEGAAKVKDNGKLAQMIQTAMSKKKRVPLWTLFASQGIIGAGKGTGTELMNHFGDFGKIRAASEEELEKVPNIGKITAQSVKLFFDNNKTMLDDLLNFVEPESLNVDGPLKGYTFVFSGSMKPFAEKQLEAKVQAQSGTVGGSVGKKMIPTDPDNPTAFLVAGEGSGSKTAKAKELGVPIIDVAKLLEILGE